MTAKTIVLFALLGLAIAGKMEPKVPFGKIFFPAIKNFHGSSKIIGGDDAVPHSHPHQVSLQVKGLFGSSHICGGSIISEDYVICAAHCVQGQSKGSLKIIAGAHNIKNQGDEEWQKRDVKAFIYHEDYDSSIILNDVSLIKVSVPFEFNDNVQPIALPSKGYDAEAGTICQNSGWGKYNNLPIGNLPAELQVVDLPIVDRTVCQDWYEGINGVYDGEVCAGTEEGGVSPCNGDSGGPLICPHGNGTVLAGIVSWGMVPCGQPRYPGVYTNVGHYVDWIEANMNL